MKISEEYYEKILILFLMVIIGGFNIAKAEIFIFNTKTYKYHSIYCQWALKCTKNCIKIDKKKS